MLLAKIRANSIHGFCLIIVYLFLTLLDLVKVSNPSGGVLTSSSSHVCVRVCKCSWCMCHYQVGIMQYLEHNLVKCATIV